MQRNRLIAVTLITALMLLIVPLTVSAASGAAAAGVADEKANPPAAETIGPNLLSNPGLEGHYQQQCSLKTDAPWVPAPTPCDPADYDYANRTLWATAQVPSGWAAWWRPPYRNQNDPNYYNMFPAYCPSDKPNVPADCKPWHNPEFRDTAGGPQETGPSRRMEGDNSQKYFTFYSIHEAGLYQMVSSGFKPGDRLRFSIWMEAWSSQYNDSARSDSQPTMGMKVGIDPWGGNDPWSPNIVWSNVQESFDRFSQFTVDAVAKSGQVSVWTRSQPFWSIQHNDVYVDAGSLNVVAAAKVVKPAPKTTTKVITTTKVVTSTTGVTSTVIVTKTIVVPLTTTQVVTSTRVVTSTTGVTSTVVTTRTISVPVTTPTSTKPVTGTVTSTTPVSGTQPMPAAGTYIVVRGDTLIAIARRFGILPWTKLAELNGLKEPYKIEVGQVLKLK